MRDDADGQWSGEAAVLYSSLEPLFTRLYGHLPEPLRQAVSEDKAHFVLECASRASEI